MIIIIASLVPAVMLTVIPAVVLTVMLIRVKKENKGLAPIRVKVKK